MFSSLSVALQDHQVQRYPTGQQKLLQVHLSRGVKPGKKKHGEKSIKTAKSGRRKNRRQRDIIRVSEPKCGNKKRRNKMKEGKRTKT